MLLDFVKATKFSSALIYIIAKLFHWAIPMNSIGMINKLY